MLKSNHKKEALKKLEEMTLLYHELTEQFKKNLEDVKQAQVYDQTLQTKGTTGAEVMAGVGTAAGVGVATLGPSAAMALATTFGTASTGAAISTLGGAAATNAALAWLGGGVLLLQVAGEWLPDKLY